MNTRRLKLLIFIGVALLLCVRSDAPFAHAGALADSPAPDGGLPAVPAHDQTGEAGTVQGVSVTLSELLSQPARPKNAAPRQASPRRTFDGAARPSSIAAPLTPVAGAPASGNVTGRKLPQTPVDEILGMNVTDTAGFFPPDTMGAVGPTQFLFSVNTHLRAYNKTGPHAQIWDVDEVAFWGTAADVKGVSDTHVRYDRTSQRWFITAIDVPTGDNHLLLAVSSGPDLSTATWTLFAIPATGTGAAQDAGCFADYDTPGIDQNAIYIGANMFGGLGSCTGNYLHTNLYVLQKSSALTLTLHFTQFFNVVSGTAGIATIQGVDSVDALPTGFAVAVKETESPRQHLNVWKINNPATTSPTLSAPTAIAIGAENGATGGVLTNNNVVSGSPTRRMDDIDDRLFAAVIRAGHLWTAHNVGVDSSGNSNGGLATRDAVRWYDVNTAGLTLNQSGTVFDGAASGFLEYWMGSIMVSGQGHVAMGLNRANATTNVQAGAVGRLAGDAAGTMGGFSLFQDSTADAYDDSSIIINPANRWGDYTYTSLDPCDDMTMWTVQEYVAGSADSGIDWGIAAEKLQAPPPATPFSTVPAAVPIGRPSVDVIVTGSTTNGSGFYDTPSTLTDPCRTRLGAVVVGVTVNSVTYIDPTHVKLNLSTVGVTPGLRSVKVTNPDGQSALAPVLRTAYVDYLPFVRR